ncbi:MAG: c-type cytochrome [Rhodoferax sp.]|nr:c-type cytochrome [Rhodoferax sp.]
MKNPSLISALVWVLGLAPAAALLVACDQRPTAEPVAQAASASVPASAPQPMAVASGAAVPPPASAAAPAFVPPPDSAIPDNEFGKQVKLGQRIFNNTGQEAPKFVGNSLTCANCHLDAGRLADSAPLWAAYVAYPAYRRKTGQVNTFTERLQGCFVYSMNGKAPPAGDNVLVALESYAFFLAKGAPVGTSLPGRGYPAPDDPPLAMDFARGELVFQKKCALCHGADGQGQSSHGAVVFPPLWGPQSFNWGAGMGVIKNAAAFIQGNMPLSQGNTLTDQEAWDVAMFMDSHERPQDPRFTGSIAETRQKHHDSPDDMYGLTVNGQLLGKGVGPTVKP